MSEEIKKAHKKIYDKCMTKDIEELLEVTFRDRPMLEPLRQALFDKVKELKEKAKLAQ